MFRDSGPSWLKVSVRPLQAAQPALPEVCMPVSPSSAVSGASAVQGGWQGSGGGLGLRAGQDRRGRRTGSTAHVHHPVTVCDRHRGLWRVDPPPNDTHTRPREILVYSPQTHIHRPFLDAARSLCARSGGERGEHSASRPGVHAPWSAGWADPASPGSECPSVGESRRNQGALHPDPGF